MQAESSVVTQVLCVRCVVQQLKIQKWGFSLGSCALVPSKDLFYRRAMPLLSSLDERRELKLLPPARLCQHRMHLRVPRSRWGWEQEGRAVPGMGERERRLCDWCLALKTKLDFNILQEESPIKIVSVND